MPSLNWPLVGLHKQKRRWNWCNRKGITFTLYAQLPLLLSPKYTIIFGATSLNAIPLKCTTEVEGWLRPSFFVAVNLHIWFLYPNFVSPLWLSRPVKLQAITPQVFDFKNIKLRKRILRAQYITIERGHIMTSHLCMRVQIDMRKLQKAI